MKKNKLSIGSNTMWESSRMILPEWRERYLQEIEDMVKEDPPMMDAQLWEELEQVLRYGWTEKRELFLHFWMDGHFYEQYGVCTYINHLEKKIHWKANTGDYEHIPFKHIKNVLLHEDE